MRALHPFLPACGAILLAACAAAPSADAGLRCHGACISHEDGYQWAQQGTLTDPRACEGYGSSEFMRGCRDAVNDFSQMQPASKGL